MLLNFTKITLPKVVSVYCNYTFIVRGVDYIFLTHQALNINTCMSLT